MEQDIIEKKDLVRKVTNGFIIQDFHVDKDNNAECVEQTFIGGDDVVYENEMGEPLDVEDLKEKPCSIHVVQPGNEYWILHIWGDVEPEFIGPYKNWDDMIKAAEELKKTDPEQKNGIYHITLPPKITPDINTYSGRSIDELIE